MSGGVWVVLVVVLLSCSSIWCAGGELPDNGPDAGWFEGKIYDGFLGNPCVTLADDKGPIGCRTPNDGISGALYRVASESDLDDVLEKVSTFNGSPGAILVAPEAVSGQLISKAQNASGIIGILFEDFSSPNSRRPAEFSPASSFPNQRYGLGSSSSHVWNQKGLDLIMSNSAKPWFSLGPADTYRVRETLSKRNDVRMGVEFTLQMKTTSNMETCLRRGWCDRVGGVSVVASASNMTALKEVKKKVVVVVSSLDTTSMFHTRAPGAVSDMSGAVATLAAFKVLAETYGSTKDVLRPSVFHWFTAEAWGYAGSNTFIQDLISGNGPYGPEDIYAVVEAKQVGSKGAQGLFVHQNSDNANDVAVKALVSQKRVQPFLTGNLGVPPSSTMAFLQKWPLTPHAVLTDHQETYRNAFYQSMFDDFENVDPALVCDAATALANGVAKLQEYSHPAVLQANCSFVTELLSCLTKDWHCPMFEAYVGKGNMDRAGEFPTNHCGVWMGLSNMMPTTKVFHDIAAELTAQTPSPKTCGRNADCDLNRYSCIRGQCVDITNSRFWGAVSNNFSESQWMNLGFRLFVQDSPVSQVVQVSTGVGVTLASLVLCIIIARKLNQ